MTDEFVKPTPLRVHLALGGLVAGLLVAIALFLSRFPLECGAGSHVVTTWLTQWCSLDRTGTGAEAAPGAPRSGAAHP